MRVYELDSKPDPGLRWTFDEVAGDAAQDLFDRFAALLDGEDRPRDPRPR